MKLNREKIIGFVIVLIAFFSITSALSARASFLQDIFYSDDNKKEESVFNIADLDSDDDGLSDKEEYKIGTNPYSSDSDDDGYIDSDEVKAGYDPLMKDVNDLVDVDGDGLSGEDEKKYATNPQKADTDYDGYDDGLEIISGHDPLTADYSFLDPMISKADNEEGGNNSTAETNTDNSSVDESYHFDRSTPESIEGILNAKTFSEVNAQDFSTIGIDTSKLELDSNINIADVSDNEIKITSDTSKEYLQDYFNIVGIILYSNSPVHSVEEAESFASEVNIMNSIQVGELQSTASNIRKEFFELEVPGKEEFIVFHKKIIGSAITLENMFASLKEINFNRDDAFYKVMNLLPKFSGLNDYIFDDVYPEAQRLAEENGVELPKKDLLEEFK